MAKIPEKYQAAINGAFPNNVCLVGTVGADGVPNISPKGSMMVFDGDTLAYWERGKKQAWANVQKNPNVVVWYRNTELRQTLLPAGGVMRFYGKATVYESGDIREKVWDRVIEPEKKPDPEKKGAAIVIKIDRAEHLNGKPLE